MHRACGENVVRAYIRHVVDVRCFLESRILLLAGLAYGPHVRVPMREFDRMSPAGMPVRQYPDICHSDSAQYEVYQWDPRLAATHGRLVVNPMPQYFYHIAKMRMNASYAVHQAGFGAYSEGISDDLNKVAHVD